MHWVAAQFVQRLETQDQSDKYITISQELLDENFMKRITGDETGCMILMRYQKSSYHNGLLKVLVNN